MVVMNSGIYIYWLVHTHYISQDIATAFLVHHELSDPLLITLTVLSTQDSLSMRNEWHNFVTQCITSKTHTQPDFLHIVYMNPSQIRMHFTWVWVPSLHHKCCCWVENHSFVHTRHAHACTRKSTVDLEIFMLENFRVLNFRVKIFSESRIPTKNFFDGIKSILRSQVWWSGTRHCTPRKRGVCYIHGYHTAVGKLLAREREPKNAVGTYCGSEDRRFVGHWAETRKL